MYSAVSTVSLNYVHTTQLRLPRTNSPRTELNSGRYNTEQHHDSSLQASIPPFARSMVFTTLVECSCPWVQLGSASSWRDWSKGWSELSGRSCVLVDRYESSSYILSPDFVRACQRFRGACTDHYVLLWGLQRILCSLVRIFALDWTNLWICFWFWDLVNFFSSS